MLRFAGATPFHSRAHLREAFFARFLADAFFVVFFAAFFGAFFDAFFAVFFSEAAGFAVFLGVALLLRVGHAVNETVVADQPESLDRERRSNIGVVNGEQVITILGFAAQGQV